MHIWNNDITQATDQNYICHPIANKLYSLNCWYYSVVYKKSSYQLMIFVSFSIEDNIIPCSYRSPLSYLNSCIPSKYNIYIANSQATVESDSALYGPLIYQLPNLMSIFNRLGLSKIQSRSEEHGTVSYLGSVLGEGLLSICQEDQESAHLSY